VVCYKKKQLRRQLLGILGTSVMNNTNIYFQDFFLQFWALAVSLKNFWEGFVHIETCQFETQILITERQKHIPDFAELKIRVSK